MQSQPPLKTISPPAKNCCEALPKKIHGSALLSPIVC
jgi:hypothetical protein